MNRTPKLGLHPLPGGRWLATYPARDAGVLQQAHKDKRKACERLEEYARATGHWRDTE